jgi:hypothetical protein
MCPGTCAYYHYSDFLMRSEHIWYILCWLQELGLEYHRLIFACIRDSRGVAAAVVTIEHSS